MSDLKQAAQQALDALKAMQSCAAEMRCGLRICDEAIDQLEATLAQQAEPVVEPVVEPVCRADGRCQYAIDVGAEDLGHCPKGKCVMAGHQPEFKKSLCDGGVCGVGGYCDQCPKQQAAPVQAEPVQAEPVACGHEPIDWVWDYVEPQQAEPVDADLTAVRESQQRARLDLRLAGRTKGPSCDTEFGVPHLAEAEAQQAEPVAWVGLTDAEIYECWPGVESMFKIARAIEAALKEKNAKPVQAEPVVETGDDDLPDRLLQIHRAAAAAAVAKWQREQAEPVVEPVDIKAVRESQQRAQLDLRLAGRKKNASADTEFGVPHLAEDADEAQQQAEWVACFIGAKGSAFDSPTTKRAYTYAEQPGNLAAYKLGDACDAAALQSAGDNIDRGLALLQELQKKGFGVFVLGAEYTALAQQAEPFIEEASDVVLVLSGEKWVREGRAISTAVQTEPGVESMLRAGKFCDANCTAMDHHPDCQIGNH